MFGPPLRKLTSSQLLLLGRLIARAGISADAVTVAGVILSGVGAGLIARGYFFAAGWVILGAGFGDLLDGATARASARQSPRGAFLDSFADRVFDGLVFSGIILYFVFVAQPAPAALGLGLAALLLSYLIPYVGARARALGFEYGPRLMGRVEKVFVVAVGLILDILLPALAVLVLLSVARLVRQFYDVWRQGAHPAPAGKPT